MKTAISAVFAFFWASSAAFAQYQNNSRYYDTRYGPPSGNYNITIRQNADDAEQQLLNRLDNPYLNIFQKDEIQRQLDTVRQNKAAAAAAPLAAAAEARREDAAAAANREAAADARREKAEAAAEARRAAAENRRAAAVAAAATEVQEAKLQEVAPHVVVRGIVKIGGRRGALIAGGQTVFSNDVFSTVCKDRVITWRVLEVTAEGARFAPETTTSVATPPTAR